MTTRDYFLYLDEEDMIKAGVLNMKRCVEVIDETFKLVGKGDYLMGGPRENEHGIMLWFPEKTRTKRMPVAGPDRRFMSMISYLGGRFHVIGNKWYGSNIENRKLKLPRSIHTMTLNDPDTAEPLVIMAGNLISAMRTGAVPGVAAKYLANKNAEVAGVIGTGVINRSSLLAICETAPKLKKVKVFDLNVEAAKRFKKDMKKEIESIEIDIVSSIEECVVNSDIINVATSGHVKPKIEDNWLKDGVLLALTGSASLSDETYLNSTIVADNWRMHEAWLQDGREHAKGVESVKEWAITGDLLTLYEQGKILEEEITDLGDIVKTNASPRTNPEDRVIFVTGGLPVEDVAWAYEVYQKALEKDLGQKLALWDQPHWA